MDDVAQTVPPPAESAEPENALDAKPDGKDIQDALEALAQATRNEVTDDIEFAFASESEEWVIPTGRFNDTGHQVSLRVKVRDPKRPELAAQYLNAVQRLGEEKAGAALWQACVISPKALKNPVNYAKTTSSFRATLTHRLMVLIGVNGDFLAAQLAMGSTAHQIGTSSSTKSPAPTVSTRAPSSISPHENSMSPTSMLRPSEPVNVQSM